MSDRIGPYQVIDFPAERRGMPSFNELYWRKHCIYGLLEVDVTVARQFIDDYEARTGEQLSFTGYLAYCLARAVDENKMVQARMKGRNQLVMFDDVNVGLTIERKVGDEHALMGHVIRAANRKSYQEIHREIRTAQSTPPPPDRGMDTWFRKALAMPWPLSSLFQTFLRLANRRDPTIIAAMGGTVGITAVGMFGKGQGGWGIVPLPYSLGLVVGSIARKPAVVDERIEPHDILNLTLVFDHDVIDGAPATRFARRLVELIESGYGLAVETGTHSVSEQIDAAVAIVVN